MALCNGFSVEKSIADLFEEPDIRPFVDLLFKFTLQVRKADGSLYPPSSYVLTFSSCYLLAVFRCCLFCCYFYFFTAFHDWFCRVQNMIRAIGRCIRDRYGQRARETSFVSYAFNIMTDPRCVIISFCVMLLVLLSVSYTYWMRWCLFAGTPRYGMQARRQSNSLWGKVWVQTHNQVEARI
jgi:hypothetical protein